MDRARTAGSVVLRSPGPLSHVLSSPQREALCDHCWGGLGQRGPLGGLGQGGPALCCSLVSYCSEGCREEGRGVHEGECGLGGVARLPDRLRLVRLYCIVYTLHSTLHIVHLHITQ